MLKRLVLRGDVCIEAYIRFLQELGVWALSPFTCLLEADGAFAFTAMIHDTNRRASGNPQGCLSQDKSAGAGCMQNCFPCRLVIDKTWNELFRYKIRTNEKFYRWRFTPQKHWSRQQPTLHDSRNGSLKIVASTTCMQSNHWYPGSTGWKHPALVFCLLCK